MKNKQLQKQLDFISGCVLIAFPVVLLVEDLYSAETSPLKFLASLLAAWLFGASLIALSHLAWKYSPRAVIVAGIFGLAGIFGSVGIMVFRFVVGTIQQTEGAIGNAAQFDSAVGKATPFIFTFGLLTPLMLMFLSAILLKNERTAKWSWALVCAGALLFPAGRIFLGQPVILLSDVLLLIGLGFSGWQMLSGKRGEHLVLETKVA